MDMWPADLHLRVLICKSSFDLMRAFVSVASAYITYFHQKHYLIIFIFVS